MGSTSGDNEGSGFPRRYIDCTRPWTTRLCLLYRSLHAYDLVICASSCGWPDTYSVAPTPMPFSAVRWVSVVAVDAVDFPLDLTFPPSSPLFPLHHSFLPPNQSSCPSSFTLLSPLSQSYLPHRSFLSGSYEHHTHHTWHTHYLWKVL
jgi:hypothetical protein